MDLSYKWKRWRYQMRAKRYQRQRVRNTINLPIKWRCVLDFLVSFFGIELAMSLGLTFAILDGIIPGAMSVAAIIVSAIIYLTIIYVTCIIVSNKWASRDFCIGAALMAYGIVVALSLLLGFAWPIVAQAMFLPLFLFYVFGMSAFASFFLMYVVMLAVLGAAYLYLGKKGKIR